MSYKSTDVLVNEDLALDPEGLMVKASLRSPCTRMTCIKPDSRNRASSPPHIIRSATCMSLRRNSVVSTSCLSSKDVTAGGSRDDQYPMSLWKQVPLVYHAWMKEYSFHLARRPPLLQNLVHSVHTRSYLMRGGRPRDSFGPLRFGSLESCSLMRDIHRLNGGQKPATKPSASPEASLF